MPATQSDIDQYLNQARVKLTAASDAGIIAATFDVMREWFQYTQSWMENIDIAVLASTVDYDIIPVEGGTIMTLLGVVDSNGLPIPALMPNIGTITLQNPTNTNTTYTVSVSKTLALPNDKNNFPIVPDWVLPLYGYQILHGLYGNMMSQKNMAWTDQKWAMYHLKRFQNFMASARTDVLRRRTLGSQAWTYPRANYTSSQRGGVSTGNPARFT